MSVLENALNNVDNIEASRRNAAIDVLKEHQSIEALEKLQALARDGSMPNRQLYAALALAERTDCEDIVVVDGLTRVLQSGVIDNMLLAIECLTKINTPEAALAIADCFGKDHGKYYNTLINARVITALCAMNTDNLLDICHAIYAKDVSISKGEIIQKIKELS
jgi:hypothetical protein